MGPKSNQSAFATKGLIDELKTTLGWRLGPYPGANREPDIKRLSTQWVDLSRKTETGFVHFGLDQKQRKDVVSLEEELLQDAGVPKHSPEFLERRTELYLRQLATADSQKERKESLRLFLAEVFAEPFDWTVVAFVDSLKMNREELRLGSVKLVRADLAHLTEEVPELGMFPPDLLKQKRDSVALVASIKASNEIDARHFAKDLTRSCLNIFASFYAKWPSLSVEMVCVVPKGGGVSMGFEKDPEVLFRESKDSSPTVDKDEDALSEMLNDFGPIVAKLGATELNGRLLQGLYWLRESRLDYNSPTRLVKLFSAIEAFVGESGSGLTERMVRRTKAILAWAGVSFPGFPTSATLNSLYNKRSAVVHGRQAFISKMDVDVLDKMTTFATRAVARAITHEGCSLLRELLDLVKAK
jgi:hypothetical protein